MALLDEWQPVFQSQKTQPTFTQVKQDHLTILESRLRAAVLERPLNPLPGPEDQKPLSTEDLGMSLFKAGLSNEAVEHVIATMAKIVRLNAWYRSVKMDGRPTEHEIVAHMMVPLMLGMGWSEQLVAIEWNHTDVTFFRATPQKDRDPRKDCVMLLEAKRPDQSLDGAYKQATDYVTENLLDNCRRIITTDGAHLLLYKRDPQGDWPPTPSGYVKLSRVRECNLFPMGTSGVETLMELVPWKAMF